MSWSARYVGISHVDHGRGAQGCDCWGLLRLIYLQERGIVLPCYGTQYIDTHERANLARIIADQAPSNWHAVHTIQPFDGILMRQGRHASHIGIAVDAAHMIHVEARSDARIARLSDPRFHSRIKGVFRYVGSDQRPTRSAR